MTAAPRQTQPPPATGKSHLQLVADGRSALAAEFQPDAIEIEERKPPKLARATLYAVLALIGSSVTWAAISHVDEVVTASGKLISTAPHIVVQPLETSIVRTFDAAVGDVVRRGQVLAQLDPTFSEADLGQLSIRLAAFDAQIARLEAELANTAYRAGSPASADELLQERLWKQRRSSLDSAIANADAQIARDTAALASSVKEETHLQARRTGLLEIEQMRSTLFQHQTGSRLNYLLSKDARIDVDANISRLNGRAAELKHAIEKANTERQTTIEDFRRAALELLVDTRNKRNATAEDLKKAELRRSMVKLTSPTDGIVLEIAQRSIGSVVREAEAMYVIVPLDAKLEAEVQAEGRDMGHLKAGQAVRVKFDAFPFQKHGTASGTVRLISQDSFSNDQAKAGSERAPRPPSIMYRIRIELTGTNLKALPEGFRMLAGMPVTAEVKVGVHNVAAYFLNPLLRGIDESLKEP